MDFMVYLYIQGARGEFCCLVVKPGPSGAFLSQRRWTAITMGSFRRRSARAALADRPFKRECSFLSQARGFRDPDTHTSFFITTGIYMSFLSHARIHVFRLMKATIWPPLSYCVLLFSIYVYSNKCTL